MIGRQISHFYIIRTIGSGGMGIVYEAQDTRLPRSVAVKVLKPTVARDVDAIRRFKREARLAASLNHPNICTVLDVDEGPEQSFIAMELLHGRSLKARLADGRPEIGEILDIASQILDGLSVAHAQGIIHRDLTPANVFLTASGLVKLLDFGLARRLSTEDSSQSTEELTAPGVVAGTLHYMSPEQLADDDAVDYRCDLFSLGAVLYQMATGARPFDLQPKTALIAAISSEPHVPIRQLVPDHPEPLERIVDRLLAKRPDDRYQSARAVRTDIDALRVRLTAAPPAEPASRSTSVAVLPFVVVGVVEPAVAALADALGDAVRLRFGSVAGVRVAPRTSSAAVSGRTVREIGRALDVSLVLEGTVQQAGADVRATATLVAAADERAVQAPVTVDRRVDRDAPFALQDDLARAIGQACAGALQSDPEGRAVPSPEAYHAFKRGQHHWKSCFAGGWRAAIEHYQYAIERDPRFVLAHVALANAYNFLGFYCLMKPHLAFGVAARTAENALAIDERTAPAHRELALARFGGEWDWDGAEAAFRRALALDAADPLAHVHYSWLLILLGREDAALAEAQRGHALAPASRLVAASRAQTLYLGRRYEEALSVCAGCLEVDPDYVFAVHLRGLCQMELGAREPALADLRRAASLAGDTPFYLGLLGRAYGHFGMRDEALALVAELGRRGHDTYVPPQCYVFIYAALGDEAQAPAHQDQAYADGASPFNYLMPSIRDLYALAPEHRRRLEQMRLRLL